MTSSTEADDALRRRLLEAMLREVPFDGWTATSLRRALAAAGASELDAERLFSGGIVGVIRFFVDEADRAMVAAAPAEQLAQLPVRARIARLIRARLESLAPHRESIRRAVGTQVRAASSSLLHSLYGTVDTIWREVGDTATDFSFYTKRATLAAVYAATLLYWLDDGSEGSSDTWAFLERRLDNVMAFYKARGRAERFLSRLPDPVRFFRHSPLGGRR
jgi:ubiquinone biosynthesis protein COQ9